jgi:hypothetical protein
MSRSILVISVLSLSISCSLFESEEIQNEEKVEEVEVSPAAAWVAFVQPLFDRDRELEDKLSGLAAQVHCAGGTESVSEERSEACAATPSEAELITADAIALELSESLIPDAHSLVEALDQYGQTETRCSLDGSTEPECPHGQTCRPDTLSPDAMSSTGTCHEPTGDPRLTTLHRELQAHWMDRAVGFQALLDAWSDSDLEALESAFDERLRNRKVLGDWLDRAQNLLSAQGLQLTL